VLGGVLDFIEVVIEVANRGLQVIVAEEYLHVADVEALVEPLFGSEALAAKRRRLCKVKRLPLSGVNPARWHQRVNQRCSVLCCNALPWRPRKTGPVLGKSDSIRSV